MNNIILVGMPASGKSTLGKLLSERMGYDFLDTDDVIIERYEKPLMHLIQEHGAQGFTELENKVLLSIHTARTIVATGGSAVYSKEAMQYWRTQGTIVYLYHKPSDIIRNVGNLITRGVVCPGNLTTVEELFQQRDPLYREISDIMVDCTERSLDYCIEAILRSLPHREK